MSKKRDWSAAKIKYEVAKKGLTLYAASINAGFNKRAASCAIQAPHPKGEVAIAQALDIAPHIIWPSRYDNNGVRLKPQPNTNYNQNLQNNNIKKSSKIRHSNKEVKNAS